MADQFYSAWYDHMQRPPSHRSTRRRNRTRAMYIRLAERLRTRATQERRAVYLKEQHAYEAVARGEDVFPTSQDVTAPSGGGASSEHEAVPYLSTAMDVDALSDATEDYVVVETPPAVYPFPTWLWRALFLRAR